MSPISQKEQQKILQVLRAHGVNRPCPRCGNTGFQLLNGYLKESIQDNLKGTVLGGPSLPSVVTVCDSCGYMSQHALGPLGLMPKK